MKGVGVTPIEILNKEFDKRFRGYDEEQVNDYLDVVASELDRVVKEHSELKQQLAAASDKLRYFEQLQDSLNNSIVIAHEAAERLKQNARKEAELILYEAEREADRLVADANAQAQHIMANNENLKRSGQELHKQLRYMLTSQLEALDGSKEAELLQPVEMVTPMTVAQEPPHHEVPEVSQFVQEATVEMEQGASVDAQPLDFQAISEPEAELSFEEVSDFVVVEEPVEVGATPEVYSNESVETFEPASTTKPNLPDYDAEERYIPEPTLQEVNAADLTTLLNQALEQDLSANAPADMESVLGQTIRIDLPK